jgi:hypothetical protein
MRRRTLFASLATPFILSGQDKKPKQPELEIVQVSVHRIDDQLLAADGSIRNPGTKSYSKVQIIFEFFAPGKQSITIQRGAPEPDLIGPGELVEFHLQLRAPARAVQVTLGAEDGSGRELRVGKPGPYPVE